MSDALRSRLSALVRDSGRAIARSADAVADAAGDWSTKIGALREAQRVRESRSRAAERALPGDEVAPGVRVVRSVEARTAPSPSTEGEGWGGVVARPSNPSPTLPCGAGEGEQLAS
ncbi:MAG TPA: hypothetical protein VFO79_05415 [Xanthomonadales bacterium]|nr:hypothetical protein [Xanthomonadales bacterium]